MPRVGSLPGDWSRNVLSDMEPELPCLRNPLPLAFPPALPMEPMELCLFTVRFVWTSAIGTGEAA